MDKRKAPLNRHDLAGLFLYLIWRRAIFPEACATSIVAAEAFHGRVRNGNGWVRNAIDTRNLDPAMAGREI